MASLLSWAKKRAKGVAAQINPFDDNQTYSTVVNNRPPAPPQGRNLASRVFDQLNPVDSGRTFKQAIPTKPQMSAFDQLANSGAFHVGRDVYQGTMRSLPRVANEILSVRDQLTPRIEPPRTYTPGSRVEKAIFGNQTVKGFRQAGEEFGAKGIVAPVIGLGATGLDAVPGGKVVKTASIPAVKKAIKNPNALDIAARSTTGVLNKIDPRLGDMVWKRRELAEVGAAKAKAQLKVTETLKKNEEVNLARVLKGTEKPINPRVEEAAKETRRVLNATYHQAKATGVKVTGYRKNYFPQIHNPKSFKEGTKQSDAAIRHLITTKQAKNEAEAIGLLRMYKNTRTLNPYGNLAKSRKLDLPGYAENKAALHQYLDRAHASIAHRKLFGEDDKILNNILAQVKKNGGDYEQAIKSYRQASGLTRGSEMGERVASGLTNFQGATKLGLSSILNLTQPVNTATVAGIGRTLKTYPQTLSKKNKDFLAKSGVADEQVAHEALFSEQGVTKGLRKFTAPGFEAAEKQNRRSAALAGRDLANSLAKKAAKHNKAAADRLSKEFGITKIGKRGLTENQQIQAARKLVERTQFRTGASDLPGWTQTPTGKVISQFRRYPYKQAQFLGREVLKPAAKGNLLPAARIAAMGGVVGVGAHELQKKIRGDDFQLSPVEKGLDVFGNVTGGDLLTSTLRSLYPSSYDANAYTTKVGKVLGGPTVSDAIKTVTAGFDASKGDLTNAARLGLTHVPVVGTPISNRVFPYNIQPKEPKEGEKPTAEYMNKQSEKEKKEMEKKSTGEGYEFKQLSNGKFAYTLEGDTTVHTTEDPSKAHHEIAKDKFDKSGAKKKLIGDTYFYKEKDGDIKSKPKVQYEYEQKDAKNKLELDRAYEAGDLDKWLGLAEQQYDNLETRKSLYDPDTEQDEIDKITLQQENLIQKAEKYLEKGFGSGSKKGGKKSGGRGSRGGKKTTFNTTGFKTASTKATKTKDIKVKKPTYKQAAIKKLNVSKMPKIS